MNTPSSTHRIRPQAHYHFVTGKLAQAALREVVSDLAAQTAMRYSISVLPITVAALMTSRWLLRHLVVPEGVDVVVLPGYLAQQQASIAQQLGVEVICGPRDLRQLPEFFGAAVPKDDVMDAYRIRIIAEINHAPRLAVDQLVQSAKALVDDGADMIDLGCDPGRRWRTIGDVVRRFRDQGIAVSVDTFDSWEASQAAAGGASLVLSVNSTNRDAAADWGCEVVVVPDRTDDLRSFDETIEQLSARNVAMRLDPILDPIGMGFGAALVRYAETRRRYPDAEMMMGIGNLTELTDVDSAAVNLLLAALCEEWSIGSVLTTQVINWARTSVRECDLARRLVHYSIRRQVPLKHLSDELLLLRDPKLRPFSPEFLAELASQIRDNNYRIFAQDGEVHLLSAGMHLSDPDPFAVFESLLERPESQNVDAGHAFYLGFEMCKALTALTLGKQYEQDESLRWGFLTQPEKHHRLTRRRRGS